MFCESSAVSVSSDWVDVSVEFVQANQKTQTKSCALEDREWRINSTVEIQVVVREVAVGVCSRFIDGFSVISVIGSVGCVLGEVEEGKEKDSVLGNGSEGLCR